MVGKDGKERRQEKNKRRLFSFLKERVHFGAAEFFFCWAAGLLPLYLTRDFFRAGTRSAPATFGRRSGGFEKRPDAPEL